MCGLYGVLSYGNKVKDMTEITEALAAVSYTHLTLPTTSRV